MQTLANTKETIIWKGIRLNTIEHCSIRYMDQRILVYGQITGLYDPIHPVNIYYTIELNKLYETQVVRLQSCTDDSFEVDMVRENRQWFNRAGKHLIEYDDCDDIDIALTPFTNTLPIKRLNMGVGSSKKIRVIFIDPIEKTIECAAQRYSHIADGKYLYENLQSGFASDLFVNQQGVVTSYPGIWKMIFPAPLDSVSENVPVTTSEFSAALISQHRSPDMKPDWDIYARLLGNWRLKMIDYDAKDMKSRPHTGLWYFSRTLEGRAIQDVLVSPEFAERTAGTSIIGNRYGNTFRMIDPVTHQWKIDWFNPVSGIHNHLLARTEGEKIVQETPETGGMTMRWVFENITDNSFHWYGENSTDNGKTWKVSSEFFASRIND